MASPVVQLGNYVASNLGGSTPSFVIYVSDPAANPLAEDIEGMDFTFQLGSGTGLTPPAISSVDLITNTVWSGNVDPNQGGGIFPASGNGPQWQSYAVITNFVNNAGVAINPNGALANVTLNTDGASTGVVAVKLVGTKDPTRDTAFSDGSGQPVSSTITNGTLTIVNNPVVYWTGTTSNAWDTTSNWSSAASPNSGQDAYFGNHTPASGATILLTALPETVHNLWFDGSYTLAGGKINMSGVGAGKVTVFSGSNVFINSEINGNAGLTLAGGGNLTLGGSAANTYTGDTNVNAGTLTLSSGGVAIIPGGNLNINGATVQFNAQAQTTNQVAVTLTNGASTATMSLAHFASQSIGSLSGNGSIAFPSTGAMTPTTLTIGNNNASTEFSGSITGLGHIIKQGTGTLTLSGSSLSVPRVQVSAGTLTFSNVAPNLSGTTLDGHWIVTGGTLNFPAGSSVITIASTGSVELGQASFPAIAALSSNQGTFIVTGGKTFTTTADLTNDGTLFVVNDGLGNGGHFIVAGGLANSGTPGTAGGVQVDAASTLSANYIRQSGLNVTGAASINTLANGGGTSVLSFLALGNTASAPQGKLDIADNKLIVNDSSANHANTAAAINTEVNAAARTDPGTAKPRWDSPGITSSVVATGGAGGGVDTAHSIGVADNTTLGAFQRTSFGGQNVNASSILIGYTLAGDSNMDGKVTFADFQNLLSDYGQLGTWQQGDFNHDGKVSFADFQLLLSEYGQSMPGAGPAFISAAEYDAVESFAQSVPEPGSAGLLMGGVALGLLRRRVRNRN
jgi:fibronectin-binding autotransporter adhesin